MNDLAQLFEFIQFLEKAKRSLRWRDTPTLIKKESVADHSWKVSVMSYVIIKNLNLNIDTLKVVKLSLVHDIVQLVSGNTDHRLAYLGLIDNDIVHKNELRAINEIKNILPVDLGTEIYDLWNEYDNWTTEESKFVKLVEKIESIDHLLFYGASSIDIPDKVARYCHKALQKYPALRGFYSGYAKKLKDIYEKAGFEWNEEYEVKGDYEEFVEFDKIFSFFQLAQKLKETVRYDASPLITEKDTVAEHVFRLALIVMTIHPSFNSDTNILRALGIVLFHDIPESIAGDVDNIKIYTGKVTAEEKHDNEQNAMDKIKNMLPEKLGNEIYGYWQEYENGESKEAILVKALDKFESISHLLYYTHTNFDEPDLIAGYCDKVFKKIPELNPLLKILKRGLKEEYAKKGWEWKVVYDLV